MVKALFLVSFIVSQLLMTETKAFQYATDQPGIEVNKKHWNIQKNDRSGETNRDFSNMLQDGFIYGAFKVTQGRGKLDCIDEGMTIMRAVAGLFWKTFVDKTEKNEMD